MSPTLATLTSLVVGGIVFVVLFVILSVTLWVSILAGAVAAVVLILASTGTKASRQGAPAHPHGA